MHDLSTRTRYSPVTILVLVITLLAAWALANPVPTAGAQTTDDTIVDPPSPPPAAVIGFAKYDGIDGESQDSNHDKWIDVLSIDWGANKPGGGATGQSRRRGATVVEDMVITFDYEKASPKLEEKTLKGDIIPKLEIELVQAGGQGGQTYLKYEFTNVRITSYQISASGATGGRPIVVMSNSFEEVKVTYTEYADDGSTKGKVEYEWNVERGR